MTKILISLVGHQPLPTLMAMRYLQPDKVILLSSNDPQVITLRNHLARSGKEISLLPVETDQLARTIEIIEPTPVDPWNILSITKRLSHVLRRETNAQLICDVTGGTKAMSIGLTQVARERDAEIVYIDSDTLDTRMWRYCFVEGQLGMNHDDPEQIPPLVTIQDLFYLYLGHESLQYKPNTQESQGSWFERDVRAGFQSLVDDIEQSVLVVTSGKEEADLVLRKKNRFAIVECKSLKKFNMKGIHQLNNIASERYLGTYTGKILAVNLSEPESLTSEDMKIANQHNIAILPLNSWNGTEERKHSWTDSELISFQKVVDQVFGKDN
ncbi:MAG: hypothetical protein AAF702_19520 [Chloroflexota bacterium]